MEIKSPIEIKRGEARCPRCFGKDLAPSMPRGIVDALMRRRGRIPRHCRFCGKRFYVRQEEVAGGEGVVVPAEVP